MLVERHLVRPDKSMNIYLDIDGVLITKQGVEANHLTDFLETATTWHTCRFLSTHCKGDTAHALEYLLKAVSGESLDLLEKVEPTNWSTLKTEAIDFTAPFIWLGDYAFHAEREVLAEHDALRQLIMVDLDRDPDQLLHVAGMISTL
jgi:hypothetical protein